MQDRTNPPEWGLRSCTEREGGPRQPAGKSSSARQLETKGRLVREGTALHRQSSVSSQRQRVGDTKPRVFEESSLCVAFSFCELQCEDLVSLFSFVVRVRSVQGERASSVFVLGPQRPGCGE